MPGQGQEGDTTSSSQDPAIALQGTLEAQRVNILIDQYTSQAKKLIAEMRYEDAKVMLLKAQDVDRDNAEVQKLLGITLRELGERQGDVSSYRDYMAQQLMVRIQKEKAQARRLIGEAKKARENGNYEEAISKLKEVRIKVEVGRNIDWEEIAPTSDELLTRYESERDDAIRERQSRADREAFRRMQERTREAEERLDRQVIDLLAKGTKSFESHQYDRALEYSQQALRLRPMNEIGRQLMSASDKALRDVVNDSYIANKAREFKKYLAFVQEQKTTYTDWLNGPDMDHWMKISALRSAGLESEFGTATKTAETIALEKILRTTYLPKGMTFEEDTGYSEVITEVNSVTGVNVLVSPEANAAIEDNGYTLTLTLGAPISLRNFLSILVEKTEGALAYMIQDGTVILTTKAKSLGKPTLVVHSISDLTIQITNFTGPIIRDIPRAGDDEETESRTGGEEEEPITFVDPSQLEELVRKHVSPGSWDADGVQIEATNSQLIVQHTPEIQRQIRTFLNDLRKFSTSLVAIESKFLNVDRNFMEQIGVDWRGLGGANSKGTEAQLDDLTNGPPDNASRGLDNNGTQSPSGAPVAGVFFDDGLDGDFRARTENFFTTGLGEVLTGRGGATIGLTLLDDTQLNLLIRAVSKNEDIQEVDSQMLTVLNGQRANVSVIVQTAFVQDFNVEVAQAAFIADPEVNIIQDGVVLDVQPTISYDRKYITLELQPTVAELVRPIPTFTTSLSGTTLPVTIQFPQMTVQSAATSVKVPDGGSVLIGGLNRVLNRERRAEVPWLGDLPLIGFLFKQEGVTDENSSLMVMVRASIFNVKDVMEKREREWAFWNDRNIGSSR